MTRIESLLFLPALLCSAALLVLAASGPDLAATGVAASAEFTNMSQSVASHRAWVVTLAALTLVLACAGAALAALTLSRRDRRLGTALDKAVAAACAKSAKSGGCDISAKGEETINDIIVSITTLRRDAEAQAGLVRELQGEIQAQKALRKEAARRAETSRCQSLKSAAGTLGAAIADIHKASDDLSGAAKNASRGADEQRRLTAETATAMEQMNASVAQVAQGAEAAATAAQRAMEHAKSGAGAVEETVSAIQAVNDRTAALGTIVQGLGQQAEGIGQIMTVIADIADQTNLLALNAAIEAARAGDAGRGFAVVADEVRKLAEKTMNATRDVGHQIEAIQKGVASTREGMQDAATLVEHATGVARRSGELLGEIVTLAGENSGQIQSIAAAATEQSAASEQVTRAVTQVEDISRRTVEEMGRSDQALGSLLEQVHELDGLNGVFELMGSGKVQEAISGLAASEAVLSMQPDRQEKALRDAIRKHDFLELLYLTDARGIQPIANVPRPGRETADDQKARGRNWDSRPWFTGAVEMQGLYISDVYLSQASGERCITVSMPFGPDGEPMRGVLAADVTLG